MTKKLNIEYKLGLHESMQIIDINSIVVMGCICSCPNENEVYLFGQNLTSDEWLSVLQHEEFHAILFLVGIDSKFHHNIMNRIKI